MPAPPAAPPVEERSGGDALRVYHTIGSPCSPADVVVATAVHMCVWIGAMLVGPLLLVLAPAMFLFLPFWQAAALAALVAALSLCPPLQESPAFCRLYLKTASLLKGGSTVWVAEKVLEPFVAGGNMVCYHPHGIIPMGFTLNGAVRAKTRQPKKYLHDEAVLGHDCSGVQAPVLFRIPLLRQVLQMYGCTMPATKQGMYTLFREGKTFGIVVGGSEDVAIHVRGRERIFLKSRAGFLKYALQFGYRVIIGYNFGESDLYENVSYLRPLNMWLVKNLGFVLPLFWGRWWCPVLPRGDVELHTVMGEVLQLPRVEDPSPELVAEWHGRYMEAVTRLFERHKAQFGYGARTLEIL